jgi:hypothetical protein
MRINRAVALLVLLAGLLVGPVLRGVEIGTARVNVIQELGTPAAAIARGDAETLTYRNGVKIKLKQGRVVEIIGLEPAPAAAEAAPAPAEPEEPAEPEPQLTKEQASELDRLEKEHAEANAKARAQMEKALEDLENAGQQPAMPSPTVVTIFEFVLELGLSWLLTIGALKLSCKYWNSEVPWTGIMLVSIVDVAVRGVIGYIGYKLLESPSLFYADEAVSAFVMVPLLRKVSINQRLALAVEVVFTVKTFTIVVGSFLITVALHALS